MAEHTRVARELEYYTRLALEPAVAHEARVFGLGDFLLQRFRTRRDQAMVEVQRLRLRELVQTLAFSGITTLVLHGGRIVEAGTHTDLMARGPPQPALTA